MKEFILLFRNHTVEGRYDATPEEMQASMPKWQAWIGDIVKSGNFVATQPLDYEGKVIRSGSVTDGPFAEIKEILAGYLICKTETIEEAIEIGKRCPILDYKNGSLEVRPITPFAL
jgi:hypothetical protein